MGALREARKTQAKAPSHVEDASPFRVAARRVNKSPDVVGKCCHG